MLSMTLMHFNVVFKGVKSILFSGMNKRLSTLQREQSQQMISTHENNIEWRNEIFELEKTHLNIKIANEIEIHKLN